MFVENLFKKVEERCHSASLAQLEKSTSFEVPKYVTSTHPKPDKQQAVKEKISRYGLKEKINNKVKLHLQSKEKI